MRKPVKHPFNGLLQTENGAGNGTRTRDFNLGKVALYQLSYSRPMNLGRRNLHNVAWVVKPKS